jgi:hypothetical protein
MLKNKNDENVENKENEINLKKKIQETEKITRKVLNETTEVNNYETSLLTKTKIKITESENENNREIVTPIKKVSNEVPLKNQKSPSKEYDEEIIECYYESEVKIKIK